MTLSRIIETAQSSIAGSYTLLLLFGSTARGDATDRSDVDVLQVSDNRKQSYKIGRVSVSCYTMDGLLDMAQRGSLFVLHLIREARVIGGDAANFAAIKKAFVAPTDCVELRASVVRASALLDISKSTYDLAPEYYNNTLCFLLRTYLYAMLFDRGELTFSLSNVAMAIADARLGRVWGLRGTPPAPFDEYLYGLDVLGDYMGVPRNEDGTIEALIVNAWGECSLVVHLGLRILCRSEALIPYDVLGPMWAAP